MIAAGRYKARAVQGSAELCQSSTGGEQLALEVDIDVDGTKRRVTTFLSLSEKALPFAIKRLRACGWTGTNILALTDLDANEIEVDAKEKTHEGKTRTVFDIFTPRELKPIETSARRSLAERVAAAATETATVVEELPEPDDSEVPF